MEGDNRIASVKRSVLSQKDAALIGVLQLAFVGDSVYDLFVRTRLVTGSGLPVKQMHKAAVSRVNASAQAGALERISMLLTELEQSVVRRARNAKQHVGRNVNPAHYKQATGLEALFGFLYLSGQHERLSCLMEITLEGPKEERKIE